MVIERRSSHHPRQGPSCLFVLFMLALIMTGGFVIANAQQVREIITPDPTPEPTRSAATHAARAALYERDGDFENAIISYEAATNLDSQNVDYYIPLVRLLIQTEQTETALEWATQAGEINSENDQILALWSAAYLAEGDRLDNTGKYVEASTLWAEASQKAREATRLNVNNAEAHAYLAAALVRLGPEQYYLANEAITIATTLDPNNPTIRRHMATVLEYQGEYERAIEQYQFALEANPNSAELLINLARNYWATGSIPEAIITFQDALEVNPDSADAYDGLGYMYFLIGEYPRAEENFANAVRLDPTMLRAQAHLGAARFRQFNYDGTTGAIPSLEIAIEGYQDVTPANAVYFNMLGLAYFYTKGECSQAESLFNKVLAVVPDEPNAQYGLDLCHEAELGNVSPP